MLKKSKACVFIRVALSSVILYFSSKINMSTPGRAAILIYSILPDILILMFLCLNAISLQSGRHRLVILTDFIHETTADRTGPPWISRFVFQIESGFR